MRIIKSFPILDEKAQLVSRIFDVLIKRLDYPWHFDSMELHLRDENKSMVKGGKCIIVLDYNDFFIHHMDNKGIGVLIARLLFNAIIKERELRVPDFLEEIITNREMIRLGYGEHLAYYYFLRKTADLSNMQENTKKVHNKINIFGHIAWLSFYPDDKYNSKLLRMKADPKTEKLIEASKKDLDDKKNLEKAINEYQKAFA